MRFRVAALLIVLKTTNAFVVSPFAVTPCGLSTSQLMATDLPPPPSTPMENIVTSMVVTVPQVWPSNYLSSSQLLLAEAPKSPNVASGSAISIADIRYDGVVPKTEADEYVVINNNSKDTIDVSGYYLYVATTGTQGPTFYFPKGSSIKPGTSVRIYTNEIHKETGGYSFGSGKAIWSNNGGLGVLKDDTGKKISEFKYKTN